MPKNKQAPENEELKDAGTPEEAPAEEKKQKKKTDKSEIEKLQTDLAEATDKYLRTLAEYDNFRKRSQKEKEALYTDIKADVLVKILPVLDNFDRAADNLSASYEDYRKGVDMILSQLLDVTKLLNLESFGEKGETFDPNMHNAVMHIEDPQYGDNEIVDVFIKGYKVGEKVLRPAQVRVAN